MGYIGGCTYDAVIGPDGQLEATLSLQCLGIVFAVLL